MSLYPSYEEPMVKKTSGGVTTTRKERLHMYVVEARFLVNKPNIDLGRYATLPFIEKLDPAITSKTITAADAMPLKEAQFAYNRIPDRPWCEDKPNNVCLTSRYKFEGKLPIGVTLLNNCVKVRRRSRPRSISRASCDCSRRPTRSTKRNSSN